MEHLQHFDLRQDPFQIEPDLRVYFDSPSHHDAQRRVERGLRQSKGLTVMTGEDGTGKTLLARRILNELEEEIFDANMMVMMPGAVAAEHVLQRFARQLGAEGPANDRSALMGGIYDQLAAVREEGRHSVLILDDAHLTGAAPMAEIGGLLNLEYEDRRLLSILLVGLPQLDQPVLRDAGLEQRVDVRVRLQPLDAETSAAYLAHRLQTAGGRPEILSPEAVESLFKLGGGRPRLMNTLADNALFEAFLAKRAQIGVGDVERAAEDLGIGAGGAPAPEPARSERPQAFARGPVPVEPIPSDPAADTAVEGVGYVNPSAGDEGELPTGPVEDLNSLLSDLRSTETDDDFATLLVQSDEGNGAGGALVLDEEVAVLVGDDEALSTLPTFGADNASDAKVAEATRIAFPEEATPDEADEFDQAFVKMIED